MQDKTFYNIIEELYKVHKLHNQLVSSKQPQLTPEQVKLLYALRHTEMNQKELAKTLHITEATLSVRIKRLLDIGYIVREVSQNDKRVYSIALSSQGRKKMNEMKDDMNHYHEIITKGITTQEIDTIINVIKKVQKNIEEEMK